ncbi:amidohydrolase [Amycolatopsis mediterranei S699]|uniref:Amidohydrolase n=2 Tax=Amycolatopsis mediterranei TaxID=33910 RepID=A0A9R0NTM1_AMYMS|nr:amidohydrolase family protein [Amycolatopsis mediterranei]ADJ43652.1 putative amidohydrolase [Amycolatopsis mediterranei U32]AEK40360.1 amidohydrolase [Amycolatopsis mediterranei S699]AFO75364.1 amidohydrolase [Amycolatopsis mediterranei S699]AGT82493.1 amidohydrolase [Amycolatopsis mediterranei RB]KDO10256.1 amidohydrolase [Amycolatopsis mediterranei]
MIDAHHHLWDPTRREYPWMAGEAMDPIRRPYTVDDLRAVTKAAGVHATVLVQTVSSEEETAEFLATAAAEPVIAGVVGWVDLTAPDVADRLAALEGPLAGIRHQVEGEPDDDWLLRPEVVAGLSTVAAAGLAFDLLVRPAQLPAAAEVALRLPQLRLVLDHAAKPPIAAGDWELWASGVAALAARENVVCKLSGLVTEADWSGWEVGHLRRYVDHVLEVFGPARLLFGSDWPVCELAASYEVVLDAAIALTGSLSDAERLAVFEHNARTTYGLDAGGVTSSRG